MSENKYIIDKDSLTGIADVIRDKLGNGASADDPAAGYYPDPEKSVFSASFTTIGGRHQTGSARYTYIGVWGISASDMTAAFGDTICGYIKITSLGDPVSAGSDASQVTQYEFYVMPYMNNYYGTEKKFTWAKDATILIPIGDYYSSQHGQPSVSMLFYWKDSNNYKWNYDITVPNVKIEFLDQNQNLMTPAIGGFSDSLAGWSAVSDAGDLTHAFEGEVGYSPIPFSIDDMQDKITNYLTSNAVQAFSFNGYYQKNSSQPYVNLSSIFSSRQDLLNRLYNVCVWGLPGTLLIGADGHPVSMRKEGVALPSNIVSGVGGWDVTDVPTAYNNDQIFRYHFKDPNLSGNAGDTQLAYIYIPSSVTNPFIIFCLDNTIGYRINGTESNNKMIMYRRAQNESS